MPPVATPPAGGNSRHALRRAGLALAGLAVGALLLAALADGVVPVHTGRVVAPAVILRAPAEGVLRLLPAEGVVAAGQALAVLRRPAPDAAARAAVQAQVAGLRADITRLEVAARAVAEARAAFAARAEAEQRARQRLAEARLAEAEAALAAAEARRQEAEAALARAAELAARGVGTEADLARIRTAAEVAGQEAEAARLRVRLLALERDAAAEGLLPADPAGRLPEAERAARDLALRAGELAAEAAGLRAALAAAEAQLAPAAEVEEARLLAPVAGRVLAWLEAEGAPVGRGQPLLRLADCAAAAVVVTPPESRRLALAAGQAVRIRLPGGGWHEGRLEIPPEGEELRIRLAGGIAGCPLGAAAEVAFSPRPFDIFRR
jgi:biotin carboxyl carrier protein